jgi:hypothetical protein
MLFFLVLSYISMADWQAEFSDQNVNLTIQKHRKSPNCGIDFLEIGSAKGGRFEPQFALLLDRYDSSYPGVHPKVRKIYSYFLPEEKKSLHKKRSGEKSHNSTYAQPPLVLDLDAPKRSIVLKLTYDLVQTLILSASAGIAAPATFTTDQFVEGYLQKREYHLHRAIYAIKLLTESENPKLEKTVPKEELQRILAYGEERGIKGLLLDKSNVQAVTQHHEDVRNLNRSTNFANLLSVLNAEGLIAQPLFKDFVVVYYDPQKKYARNIDLEYSDLQVQPESISLRNNAHWKKTGVIPLGIYSIGAESNRLLTVDFSDPNRMKERKMIRYLTRVGTDTGTTFIPFPFSLILTVSSEGAKFLLNKSGKNLLESVLQSEAELAQLIDSGFVEIDPLLLKEAKKGLDDQKTNFFLSSQNSMKKNRSLNEKNASVFLQSRGKQICENIEIAREKEFREEYLSQGESMGRGFSKIWNSLSGKKNSYETSRKEIIEERAPLVNARNLLESYDPSEISLPVDLLMPAIEEIGKAKMRQDSPLLGRILLDNVDTELESAILRAITTHKNGNLAKFLDMYLDENPNSANKEFLGAVKHLNYDSARMPERAFTRGIDTLKRISLNKSYPAPIRKEAAVIGKSLRSQLMRWKLDQESRRGK